MTNGLTFIDSHAHLCDESVFFNVDSILQRAQSYGLQHIINICTNDITLARGIVLAKKYPWVHNVAATTPHDIEAEGEKLFSLMRHHALAGNLVAIGETGLDYFHHKSSVETQNFFLIKYLELALECNLPVVIHCRDAFSDFFDILDHHYLNHSSHLPGILHCFTGSEEEAKEVISRGWYISLSGIVTYKKSEALRLVAKRIPLDRILIETDTPYLAPQSRRGKINEPSYIIETASVIADTRGIKLEELAETTFKNTVNAFKLKIQ